MAARGVILSTFAEKGAKLKIIIIILFYQAVFPQLPKFIACIFGEIAV
jgi:hypothetical protein